MKNEKKEMCTAYPEIIRGEGERGLGRGNVKC